MIKLKSFFRRGQGPSSQQQPSAGSTKQINSNNLKNSASASSLDRLGTTNSAELLSGGSAGTSRKLSKSKHSSKDRLNELLKSSSKEKLIDEKKELKKQKKLMQQMPVPQQQSSAHVQSTNNNVTSALVGPSKQQPQLSIEIQPQPHPRTVSKDFDITFDGPKEVIKHRQHHHHYQQQQQQSTTNMQELRQQVDRLQQENMTLEIKVQEMSSYQSEVLQLRNDIQLLQQSNEINSSKLTQLEEENDGLRNRLRNVVQSPLSDAEKQQLIQDSQRLHSSAPASIALPNFIQSQELNDGTPCTTPDWDKHSSSSEISVACLQDKIIQMEETHYSTNEELQATLQELADLQNQIIELQTENERLSEEKEVIFQSLCRQTDKLEDSRGQIDTLQNLLLREPNQQDNLTTEREQKLVDLLKNAQEERESLMIKQEELNSDLNEMKQTLEESKTETDRLKERISLLDSTIDSATADRKEVERHLSSTREEVSAKFIEISRLTTLLENARSKIDELESDRKLGDKTDLEELLDAARKEKENLEIEKTLLQEQLSKSQNEIQKLKDQLAEMTEECKVTRNNAKCAISDLEYKCEQLKQDKLKVQTDYQLLLDTTNELQVQNKCHVEDKGQLENLLSETQRHLGDTERLLTEKEEKLENEIRIRKQENEEWEQFQSDLLMTVRVANDFKTEAQIAQEKLALDNKLLRDKIRGLELQIEKLNKLVTSQTESQQSIISTVQQEMAQRRKQITNGAVKNGAGNQGSNGLGNNVITTVVVPPFMSRQDSRLSVKSLIESIENTSKQTKVSSGSRSGSNTSLNSLDKMENQQQQQQQQNELPKNIQLDDSEVPETKQKLQNKINNNNNNVLISKNNNNTTNQSNSNNTFNGNQKLANTDVKPLQQQQQNEEIYPSILQSFNHHKQTMDYVRRNSYGDIGERKDPLNALVKNGGSKRNALLKWCQSKTVGYRNIDITNFSSSWNDGLALCAIMHSYLPDKIPYDTLTPADKKRNFGLAFSAAESVGIKTTLNISDMCLLERPDWQQVMGYVTAIYKHFET